MVPEAPEEEVTAPQPQPDLESLWNRITDWASGAWESIKLFFTDSFENRGGNQDSPPVEPVPEQAPEEEVESPPDS